jgi:hypothetical protein
MHEKSRAKLQRLKSDELSHTYFIKHLMCVTKKTWAKHEENKKNSTLWSDGSRTRSASTFKHSHTNDKSTKLLLPYNQFVKHFIHEPRSQVTKEITAWDTKRQSQESITKMRPDAPGGKNWTWENQEHEIGRRQNENQQRKLRVAKSARETKQRENETRGKSLRKTNPKWISD